MVGKIIIHPGFHKTGTTSIQKTLHLNGPLIWPSTALGMGEKIDPMRRAARTYSTWRSGLDLAKYSLRLNNYLNELDLPAKRKLCLSSEELAGHMPGRQNTPDYSALPELMAETVKVLEGKFGKGLDLSFFVTTRAKEPWLESAWAQQVKGSRCMMGCAEFGKIYASAANFDATLDVLETAVAPYPVVTSSLEASRNLPLGPAQKLLELLDLSPEIFAQLKPAPLQNASPDQATLAECLALNSSSADDAEVRSAKKAVLSAAFRR